METVSVPSVPSASPDPYVMLKASLLAVNEDEALVSKVYVCLQKLSVHAEPATQLKIQTSPGLLANAQCQARDPESLPAQRQITRTDQKSHYP